MLLGPAQILLLLASATEPSPERPPIPEPILIESITDIDAPAAGELELELNSSFTRSRRGGAYEAQLGPEIEWLATARLGTMLEVFGTREVPAGAAASNRVGVGAGLSWKLLHSFAHDFHLQAELRGRIPADVSTEPGESPLPLSLDLQSALQAGRWTLRSSIGVSAGGTAAHAPIRGSVVLLTGIGALQRYGFWGFEAIADAANVAPLALALDLVPDFSSVALPFRFGLAGSYSFGAEATVPSWGVVVRLFFESAREVSFAKRQARLPTTSSATELGQ